MAGDVEKLLLPSGPSLLCFDKDSFTQVDFSIDEFIGNCRRHVQLETLHEDLGTYLHILQSAMVELINKDYADFVNLSANLVGLDRAIENLIVPVAQLKEEVRNVQSTLDDFLRRTLETFGKVEDIQHKRALLQFIASAIDGVNKLAAILPTRSLSDSLAYGNRLERAALKISHLRFLTNMCAGHPLTATLMKNVEVTTGTIEQLVGESFLHSLEHRDLDSLRQCLRIYSLLGRVDAAHELFRKCLVAPFVAKVIDDDFHKVTAIDLKMIYTKLKDFMPDNYKDLLDASCSFSGGQLTEFDFLVNSMWVEVISRINVQAPFFHSMTNVQVFHERYIVTMDFIDRFESGCRSQASVKRLRASPSYVSFISKWNLAVYFQIRFQEIAGALENNLKSCDAKTEGELFRLQPTISLWQCIHQCWTKDVFLQPLAHSFWKLTMLLLSRYCTWSGDALQSELMNCVEQPEMPANAVTATSGEAVSDKAVGISIGSESNASKDLHILVLLFADVTHLKDKLKPLFDTVVKPLLPHNMMMKFSLFEDCLQDVFSSLDHRIVANRQALIQVLAEQCAAPLRFVQDIPRLYRRTNREVPAKASTYVTSIFEHMNSFIVKYRDEIPANSLQEVILSVVNGVSQQYHTVASDVLTSVKKVEDSLKRLKKAREKVSSLSASSTVSVSDDDKIRLQLSMDVEHFCQQVARLGCKTLAITSLHSLSELTESARVSPNK